jgi:IclR family transcriptional regulator, KDG regulon repressor
MKPATTVSKVCRVLAEFRSRPSMGVTELARRADLLPSDAHRILNSLALFGFIEKNPATKTYRLGMGVMKLGLTVFQRNELREAARSFLKRLSAETEATAHMAIFDSRELDIFLAEQIESTGEASFKARYGAAASPHCTALGKAIAANLDREQLLALVRKSGLPRFTTRSITHLPQLEFELSRTRLQGYSLDLEESAEGACCIGAPVCDGSGAPVAAISISMPAARFFQFSEPQLASLIKSTASELSAISFRQTGCTPEIRPR